MNQVAVNEVRQTTMVNIDKGVEMAVGIFVVIILAANLLPTAFDQIFNASTTSWNSDVTTLWELLPLLAVVGLILLFVAWARGRTGGM